MEINLISYESFAKELFELCKKYNVAIRSNYYGVSYIRNASGKYYSSEESDFTEFEFTPNIYYMTNNNDNDFTIKNEK